MPKKKPTKVFRYDGQSICTSPDPSFSGHADYELGSFLGGGAAGSVYEAECMRTKRHLAVKVLNPIGYKLAPTGSLRFCEVVVKGVPYGDSNGGVGGHGGKMSKKHVWWLVNVSTRQIIAAYYDMRTRVLKEMTLPKCIEVWGLGDDKGRRSGGRSKRDRERERLRPEDKLDRVLVGGEWLTIPSAPAKYDKFLRARASILREISNMLQLSEHPNILRLHEALELVQDSKATIFLVLELARGGELFDRIKVDCGADEDAARRYFRQLLSGVGHCHDRGVCHRDLKPENLLLADPDDASALKIADFGFSALFRELESESSSGEDSSGSSVGSGVRMRPSSVGRTRTGGSVGAGSESGSDAGKGRGVRRLTSVVGSPYYVAPEVLREESGQGYDGTKADVWSLGVILYAMLAGNLPFEKELLTCGRFKKFGNWARQLYATAALRAHCSGKTNAAMTMDRLDYPAWFFPQHFSYAARSLLSGLLHPDASSRLSVRQALRHPWVLDGCYTGSSGSGNSSDGSERSLGIAVEGAGNDVLDVEPPPDIPSELLGDDSDTGDDADPPSELKGEVQGMTPSRQGVALSENLDGRTVRKTSKQVGTHKSERDGGCSALDTAVQATAVSEASASRLKSGRDRDPDPKQASSAILSALSREISPTQSLPISEADADKDSGFEGDVEAPGELVGSLELRDVGEGKTRHLAESGARRESKLTDVETSATTQAKMIRNAVQVAVSIDTSTAKPAITSSKSLPSPRASANRTPSFTPIRARGPRPLDVFSSPPLAPMGAGHAVEEEEAAFSLDSEQLPSSGHGPLKSREGLPPVGSAYARTGAVASRTGGDAGSRSLSMGVAGTALMAAATSDGVKRDGIAVAPPAFHGRVKRSTRFMTSVPAADVLRKIATIINENAHPLPYPYRNIKQKAVVHQDEYKLEIMRGGVLVCTVQIYLLGGEQRAAQYMVEFLRGQLDIFLFKRFYEDTRCKLNDLVKRDYSLALLESGTCTQGFRRFSNLA